MLRMGGVSLIRISNTAAACRTGPYGRRQWAKATRESADCSDHGAVRPEASRLRDLESHRGLPDSGHERMQNATDTPRIRSDIRRCDGMAQLAQRARSEVCGLGIRQRDRVRSRLPGGRPVASVRGGAERERESAPPIRCRFGPDLAAVSLDDSL